MGFTIYPAVDMKRGRCVQLMQGRAEAASDYGDPLEAALRWKAEGAQWLHMIDLDGAFGAFGPSADGVTGSESGANLIAVADVVRESGLPVQLGGGVRTEEDAAYRLEELGVARVVLGTVAVEQPELAIRIAKRFPGRVALGVDARGGKVSARGWTQDSALDAIEFAKRMAGEGFMHIIFTDIARDGMMRGANAEATANLVRAVPGASVIGSGGVATLNDLRALREAGCAGAITGTAIYEGAFTLREALAI